MIQEETLDEQQTCEDATNSCAGNEEDALDELEWINDELRPFSRNQNDNSSNERVNPTLLSSLHSVLFVISSALIAFTAARNTITW